MELSYFYSRFMDFKRLDQWQRFEHLCNIILSLEVPDYHSMEGTGGDRGIDGYTGLISHPTIVFQFKYFPDKLGGGKPKPRKAGKPKRAVNPTKKPKSKKGQIEWSLDQAAMCNPKIWHLILPAKLNPTDWDWWEELKLRHPKIKYRIWHESDLTAKVLRHKEHLITEFPELFPTIELANKVSENLYRKFHNDLTSLSLAESNIQLLKPDLIPDGDIDCWKVGHFRLEDVKNDYDYRRELTDKVLNAIEVNTGVLIFGRSHMGKTTLTRRVCIEEIERGYLVLMINIPIPNSVLLTELLQRMLNQGHKLLVVVDNSDKKGVEMVLKCYNDIKDHPNVKFLFVSRNSHLVGLSALSHDDQKEAEAAITTMGKIEVRFSEADGLGFVEKAKSLYSLKLDSLQVTTLAEHFYDVSKGDPLIYVCMIMSLLKNKIDPNNIKLEANPFKYLEYDLREKISQLDEKSSLWKAAISCIFLGSWGFKISMDLLKKIDVYTDDLRKLESVGILFAEGDEYTIRHELWGLEFLVYLYSAIFNEDFDSFDHKYGLINILKMLFDNLSAYEIVVLMNRFELMLPEKRFAKFVKNLMSKIEVPMRFSNKDTADILCFGFGNFYKTAEDHKKAIKYYDDEINLNPEHSDAWNNKGNVYESLENLPDAKYSYSKSIEIQPERSNPYYNIAKIMNHEGEHLEALKYIDNAIYYDPRYTWNYHEKGNTLSQLDNLEKAMVFYNRAIEFDPSNAGAWVSIESTMLKLSRYDQVPFFLDRAERIDPNMVEVLCDRAILARLTNKSDGEGYLLKALEIDPNHIDSLREMGMVQLQLQNHEPALTYFNRVLKTNPNDIIALGNSCICLINLRRINEAIVTAAKSFKLTLTEADKDEFKKLIKLLTSSMLYYGARMSDLYVKSISVTSILDYDLLLLYLATFTNIETIQDTQNMLGIIL